MIVLQHWSSVWYIDETQQQIAFVTAEPERSCYVRCEISDWPLAPGILKPMVGGGSKWWILEFKKQFRMELDNSTHILSSPSGTYTIECPGIEQIRFEHSVLFSNLTQTKMLFVVERKFVVAFDRAACMGKVVLEITPCETVWYGNKAVCRGRFLVKRNSVYLEETRYSIGKELDLEQICCRHLFLSDEKDIVNLFQEPHIVRHY